MSRLLWATDIHLDAAERRTIESFCTRVNRESAAALLLGGDIAEGPSLDDWLRFLADRIEVPIYFVLGNHDYYGSSIARVRERIRAQKDARIRWLPDVGVVELGNRLSLVGQDGWGDGRLGDFFGSSVIFNDYLAIRELSAAFDRDTCDSGLREQRKLKEVLGRIGDEEAAMLRPFLERAVAGSRQVVCLTHVPPFREACWYGGELSDDHWLPGMSCKAMGDLLREAAEANPGCNITVLCGHTHGSGVTDILPNLRVHTGEARYGSVNYRVVEMGEEQVSVTS